MSFTDSFRMIFPGYMGIYKYKLDDIVGKQEVLMIHYSLLIAFLVKRCLVVRKVVNLILAGSHKCTTAMD